MFEEELALIKKCNNINNKLMVMTLYSALYDYLMDEFEENQDVVYNLLNLSFKVTIQNVDRYDKKGNYTPKDIVKLMANSLSKLGTMCNLPQLCEIALFFLADIDNTEALSSFVNIIKEYKDLSFDTQFDVSEEFNDFMSGLFARIREYTYDEAVSSNYIMDDLIEPLFLALQHFLYTWKVKGVTADIALPRLQPVLTEVAESTLIRKAEEGTLMISVSNSILDYTSLEMKVWSLYNAYVIAGSIEPHQEIPQNVLNTISAATNLDSIEVAAVLMRASTKNEQILKRIHKEDE